MNERTGLQEAFENEVEEVNRLYEERQKLLRRLRCQALNLEMVRGHLEGYADGLSLGTEINHETLIEALREDAAKLARMAEQ